MSNITSLQVSEMIMDEIPYKMVNIQIKVPFDGPSDKDPMHEAVDVCTRIGMDTTAGLGQVYGVLLHKDGKPDHEAGNLDIVGLDWKWYKVNHD